MNRVSIRGLLPLALLAFAALPAFGDDPAADLKSLRKEAQAAFQAQDWKKSAELLRKVVELNPKDGAAWHNLGYSLHSQGLLDDALAAHMKCADIKGQHQAAGAYNCACVYALKNDKDHAFEWLDKAVTLGFNQADLLDTDTDLASLRGDDRFAGLAERVRSNPVVVQPFVSSTDRRTTRLAWFGASNVSEIVIDYGPVPWKEEFAAMLQSGKLDGQRWRLGKEYWTTLDTNVPMTLGGAAIPVGHYYLVASKSGDEYTLIALDAAEVRAKKLDAFQAPQTKGGIVAKLEHADTKSISSDLHIELTADPDGKTGALTIEFGPHRLTAPWSAKL